ncbi:MAG TPA: methylmalonyl-CoA mutase family protein, partial [Bacteroidota bacterium]|nr:methylmalonyl-CoA mutase family protein [Bacteroidota bacterium]
ESAYRYQRAIEGREKTIVGVNAFTTESSPEVDLLRIDESAAARQVERLRATRARRDAPAVAAALSGIRSAAAGSANLLPPILGAVEAYASVGEISDALRAVWGEYAG